MKLHLVVIAAGLVFGLGAGTAVAGRPAPAPVCGTDVYVTTTVAGTPSAPGGYAIVGDGAPYRNGGTKNKRIEGRFQINNCSHDFTMGVFDLARRPTVFLGSAG